MGGVERVARTATLHLIESSTWIAWSEPHDSTMQIRSIQIRAVIGQAIMAFFYSFLIALSVWVYLASGPTVFHVWVALLILVSLPGPFLLYFFAFSYQLAAIKDDVFIPPDVPPNWFFSRRRSIHLSLIASVQVLQRPGRSGTWSILIHLKDGDRLPVS